MLYTKLGETALNVSRLAFGTWQAGGDWGAPHEKNLKAAIRRALDLGINFLDTAQANGVGASERLLGEALEPAIKSRWDEVILATKGGLQIERRPDHIQGTAPSGYCSGSSVRPLRGRPARDREHNAGRGGGGRPLA